MFISYALAQEAGAVAQTNQSFITSIVVPFLLVSLVAYFLMIRPQQKMDKQHQTQLQGLRKGDKVLTNAGIYGVVDKIISDEDVLVEIADNVKITMRKRAISLINPTPKVANKKADKTETKE